MATATPLASPAKGKPTQEIPKLVAVKIKLKRLGKIRNPQYRIVIADARNKRDGRSIEEIGLYHPKEEPSLIKVDSDRAQYWLSVGAQPTEAVRAILTVTGDWQKFKGLPGAEGTLRVAAPKTDKLTAFAAAVEDGEKAKNEPKPKLKKVAGKAEEAVETAVDKVEEVASEVAEKAEEVAEKVEKRAETVAEKVKEAVEKVEEDVKKHAPDAAEASNEAEATKEA
ncbi:MAG: 30S ribosomal protein S16 [Candidatus Nanopelagicales bacterium]